MATPPQTIPSASGSSSALRKSSPLPGLVAGLLVVVVLYFGKPVLMPLALAVLFTFLLSPMVNGLHRLKLPRPLAVVLVTLCVFSVLGALGWVIGREFSSLAAELPKYKDNIRHRIISFHQSGRGGVIGKINDIRTTIEETNAEAAAAPPLDPGASGSPTPGPSASAGNAAAPAAAPPPAPAPVPKDAQPSVDRPIPAVDAESSPGWLNGALGSAGEGLGNAATVVVFVIFMLLRQQELRNRVMRLAGFRHLTIVTRAMDETGDRVGRYLLMQALINGLYGLVLAVGLYFIGLPYVVLWGVLAALFRFVPYIGPVAVAILPSALSLAVFADWQHPLMVIGLIVVLELLTNMILEPLLYGQSVGVSEFALLVAIVFWTWLWGGIGLVMATPLTVCFVVLARYLPSLEWVDILMGDNPKVKPYMVLYQRLLAGDEVEAEDFLTAELRKKSIDEVIDESVLPAIALAKRESDQDRLTPVEEEQMHDAVLRVLTQALPPPAALAKDQAVPPSGGSPDPANESPSPPAPAPAPAPRALLLGWPLDSPADDAALRCVALHLPPGIDFDVVPGQRLTGELHAEIEARQPAALLISATPPGSHDTARLQLRRLRRQFPLLRIFVGRWGVPEEIANAAPLLEAGATAVFTRLADAESVFTTLLREAAAVSVGQGPAPPERTRPPDPGR